MHVLSSAFQDKSRRLPIATLRPWLQAKQRLAALGPAAPLPPWHGHVHSSAMPLLQDSRHRPMDLRVAAAGSIGSAGSAGTTSAVVDPAQPSESATQAIGSGAGPLQAAGTGHIGKGHDNSSWEALLRIGSAIAAEARAAVKTEAGFRTSAGIACNKMLSKLCRCGGALPAHLPLLGRF